jgi:hypothetical protein
MEITFTVLPTDEECKFGKNAFDIESFCFSSQEIEPIKDLFRPHDFIRQVVSLVLIQVSKDVNFIR